MPIIIVILSIFQLSLQLHQILNAEKRVDRTKRNLSETKARLLRKKDRMVSELDS